MTEWLATLDLLYKAIIVFFGVGGFIIFIVGLCKRWWGVFGHLNKTLDLIRAFMDNILPDLLQAVESKDPSSKGMLGKWTTIVSGGLVVSRSPKMLTKVGINLLNESGIKKVVDANKTSLMKKLAEQKTSFDIERKSFYLLISMQRDKSMNPIKEYLYDNPSIGKYNVFLVGSIYLRDEYLKLHPKINNK